MIGPMERFDRLFGSLLVFVYHCFDRVVINGYLLWIVTSRMYVVSRNGNFGWQNLRRVSAPDDGRGVFWYLRSWSIRDHFATPSRISHMMAAMFESWTG